VVLKSVLTTTLTPAEPHARVSVAELRRQRHDVPSSIPAVGTPASFAAIRAVVPALTSPLLMLLISVMAVLGVRIARR
jgi:hypothetical protein